MIEPEKEENGIKGIFLTATPDEYKLTQVIIIDFNANEQFRKQPFLSSYSLELLRGKMNISEDTKVKCEIINH